MDLVSFTHAAVAAAVAEFVIKKLPGVAAVLQHTLNLNPITDGDSYFMHYAVRNSTSLKG